MEGVPQVIPSQVCLACEGCCRFKDSQSEWRPRLTKMEKQKHLSPLDRERVGQEPGPRKDHDDYFLATEAWHAQVKCVFFQPEDHTCSIYAARPFECRLYPFLLLWENDQLALGVHLSCPYVQEHRYDPAFLEHIMAVKAYLGTESLLGILADNPHFPGRYPAERAEIELLGFLRE